MILIGLPVVLDGSDHPNAGSGLVIHPSAGGLPVQTFNHNSLRKKIRIKVSFPRDAEYESFRVQTEIIWEDVYFWEGWEAYHYTMKLLNVLNGHYLKFKRLLCRQFSMEEAPTQIHISGASA